MFWLRVGLISISAPYTVHYTDETPLALILGFKKPRIDDFHLQDCNTHRAPDCILIHITTEYILLSYSGFMNTVHACQIVPCYATPLKNALLTLSTIRRAVQRCLIEKLP